MLAEKIERWAKLQVEADILAAEITEEVMALKQTVKTGSAIATYSEGRGSYDYEEIAKYIEPDDEVVKRNSKVVVDWRKVCEESGLTEDVKQKFYKPGKPYVSLKLKPEK